MVAATGAGVYPNLVAAANAMVEIAGEYQPNAARHAEYDFYMRQYQATYRQLKGLMSDMNHKIAA